jgi:hypothetical protein
MVRVYFTNGHSSAIKAATSVETKEIFELQSPQTINDRGIVCKDKNGAVVGEFKVSEIVGYEIED